MPARFEPIILFVDRFERCLTFYQKVFGLKLLRVYRGADHPRWAELDVGGIRLCLHGKYKGPKYRPGKPLTLHFDVQNIRETLKRVRKYGGKVVAAPKKYDFFPERQIAYAASFKDPDGNTFEVQQVLKDYS